ncbi:hypothetical protein [Actinoplanes sp. M2I2]|uniref:hypothetical protein n=1 Tax=Actinoplanes sp. M2I2 TaxID=1734444 RepID=UPI002021AA75|nr:hypothetical protein [Actinoplanes sp. M2I2]
MSDADPFEVAGWRMVMGELRSEDLLVMSVSSSAGCYRRLATRFEPEVVSVSFSATRRRLPLTYS